MKVVGFTFIRNAVKFDYPIEASINSMLPLVSELYVAVGNSEDSTRWIVASISNKIRIIDTVWDDSLRKGGRVLAVETDKAYQAIPDDADWCIYLQADEVLHEKDYDHIFDVMTTYHSVPEVEGFLFNYKHFYGSYDYLATSGKWYKHEIRIVRKLKDLYSFQDAMGFRRGANKKLHVIKLDADIYHYGWVRHPRHQQDKQKNFHRLWTTDNELHKKVDQSKEEFDYDEIDLLEPYLGTHPTTMKDRIKQKNWTFNHDISIDKRSILERIRTGLYKKFGWYPGEYRNYRVLKKRPL